MPHSLTKKKKTISRKTFRCLSLLRFTLTNHNPPLRWGSPIRWFLGERQIFPYFPYQYEKKNRNEKQLVN